MQTWEYMDLKVNPDAHFYIRTFISRRRPFSIANDDQPSEVLYYVGSEHDLVGYYRTLGWEMVTQNPNRTYYLFKRPLPS